MKLQILPRSSAISAATTGSFANNFHSQDILNHNLTNAEFVSNLLGRRWSLKSPDAKINQIMISKSDEGQLHGEISFHNNTQPCLSEGMMKKNQTPSFYVVRDDLLHPLVNGNKARKLDALLPLLEDNSVTDVVSCGGCQSAHAAAIAVSCAERGIKSHLLIRGEEPETLTGYNLVSKLYGNVVYVPRSAYAERREMLARHAEAVVGPNGSITWLDNIITSSSCKTDASENLSFSQEDHFKRRENSRKVVIINEGAGDGVALLGVIRLIQYLSENHLFGNKQALNIVVDAGTGTTAVGLALGALSLCLPWKVTAVMLADKIDGYKKKEQNLISEFRKISTYSDVGGALDAGLVQWVERSLPRKFGNVIEGEVQECQKIARQTGILVDPIYTLAAWDIATRLSHNDEEDTKVVMLHTGGTLGMFGLAQRYKSHFSMWTSSG